MTNSEMMRRMGLREELVSDGKNGGKVKSRILKYLKDGKSKLLLLESRIKGGKNYKKLQDAIERSEKKLKQAKESFHKYEQKAEEYIEKNPKKAVAMAAAAGILVGSVWSSLQGNKPVPKKKK